MHYKYFVVLTQGVLICTLIKPKKIILWVEHGIKPQN
jgi:hypothetical protein